MIVGVGVDVGVGVIVGVEVGVGVGPPPPLLNTCISFTPMPNVPVRVISTRTRCADTAVNVTLL